MYQLVWTDGYGKHCIRSDDYQAVRNLFELLKKENGCLPLSLYDQFCNAIISR